jgi:alkanesulfonate monooxygenase SsuD/methylene tetrahydromethanopterin reductase-like flavin-dependent oxidoreductase (luciferase family)
MKYGLTLPYTTPRTVARLAQLAEESGWDGCFVGDAIWCEDPMIALAAAAMVTERIRLGRCASRGGSPVNPWRWIICLGDV